MIFKMTTEQFITYKYKKLDGNIKYISVDPNKSLFYDKEDTDNRKDILEPDHTHVLVYDVEDKKNKTLIIKNIIGISQNHTFYYEDTEEEDLNLDKKLNKVCNNIYIICFYCGFFLGICLFYLFTFILSLY